MNDSKGNRLSVGDRVMVWDDDAKTFWTGWLRTISNHWGGRNAPRCRVDNGGEHEKITDPNASYSRSSWVEQKYVVILDKVNSAVQGTTR